MSNKIQANQLDVAFPEAVPGLMEHIGFKVTHDFQGVGNLNITIANDEGLTNTEPYPRLSFRSRTFVANPDVEVLTYETITWDLASGFTAQAADTFGFAEGELSYLYIYACYDGTDRYLGVSASIQDEGKLYNTPAIGSGASSRTTLYTALGMTNAAIRLIGRIKIQYFGSEWPNAPTEAVVWSAGVQREPVHRNGGAWVTKSADQTIASGTPTAVTFNQEVYDTNFVHNNLADTQRMTVDGDVRKVRLTAQVAWEVNGSGFRMIEITKPGGTALPIRILSCAPAAAQLTIQQVTTPVLPVAVGDYFELEVQQTSGVDLIVDKNYTWLTMEIVE